MPTHNVSSAQSGSSTPFRTETKHFVDHYNPSNASTPLSENMRQLDIVGETEEGAFCGSIQRQGAMQHANFGSSQQPISNVQRPFDRSPQDHQTVTRPQRFNQGFPDVNPPSGGSPGSPFGAAGVNSSPGSHGYAGTPPGAIGPPGGYQNRNQGYHQSPNSAYSQPRGPNVSQAYQLQQSNNMPRYQGALQPMYPPPPNYRSTVYIPQFTTQPAENQSSTPSPSQPQKTFYPPSSLPVYRPTYQQASSDNSPASATSQATTPVQHNQSIIPMQTPSPSQYNQPLPANSPSAGQYLPHEHFSGQFHQGASSQAVNSAQFAPNLPPGGASYAPTSQYQSPTANQYAAASYAQQWQYNPSLTSQYGYGPQQQQDWWLNHPGVPQVALRYQDTETSGQPVLQQQVSQSSSRGSVGEDSEYIASKCLTIVTLVFDMLNR